MNVQMSGKMVYFCTSHVIPGVYTTALLDGLGGKVDIDVMPSDYYYQIHSSDGYGPLFPVDSDYKTLVSLALNMVIMDLMMH